jgi:hypothetical protein
LKEKLCDVMCTTRAARCSLSLIEYVPSMPIRVSNVVLQALPCCCAAHRPRIAA